jgi:hypothetical protein
MIEIMAELRESWSWKVKSENQRYQELTDGLQTFLLINLWEKLNKNDSETIQKIKLRCNEVEIIWKDSIICTHWEREEQEQRKKTSNEQYEQTKDVWNKAGDSWFDKKPEPFFYSLFLPSTLF